MWPTYYIPQQPMRTNPPPPGYIDNGCGTEAPFQPSNIPDLRVGNFMLWVCVTNVGRTWTHGAALIPPDGWKIYSSDPGRRNWNNSGVVIFYKLATIEDLDPSTIYIAKFAANIPTATTTIYRVCSTTYAFQDIHPEMPFGSHNVSRASGSADWRVTHPLFMHVGHDQCPIVLITGSKIGSGPNNNWGLQSAQPLGPVLSDEVLFNVDYVVDVGSNAFYIGRRTGGLTEGENWVAGETPTSSCLDSGWTAYAMGVNAMSGNHCRLRAGGFGDSRHYIEYEVLLTAGEEYSYHLSRRGAWSGGQAGALGVSYVDPSGNERGGIVHSTTQWGGVLDPLTDYGSVWKVRFLSEREDGMPSITGSTPMIVFTAQETGVHKLRISIVRAYSGGYYDQYVDYQWTFDGTDYRDVRGVCFRRGNNPAYFLPTPNGPIMAGEQSNGALASCWDDFSFSDPDVTCPGGVANHLSLALNKDVTLVPAVMENYINWGDTCGLTDGLIIYPTYVTSDDAEAYAASSRPVMPRINGALKQYLYEVTSLNNRHFRFGVTIGAVGAGANYIYETRTGRGIIPNADASWSAIGTPVTPVIGDKWGCLVDYINKQIKFYRNGAVIGTLNMLDTYGVANSTNSGKTTWDCPLYAFVHNGNNDYPLTFAHLSVNLAGPFAYYVADSVAFDWAAG